MLRTTRVLRKQYKLSRAGEAYTFVEFHGNLSLDRRFPAVYVVPDNITSVREFKRCGWFALAAHALEEANQSFIIVDIND